MTTTAPPTIAEAEQDILEAQRALGALHDRLVAGSRVTATDWQAAEAAIRFAEARKEAAEQQDRDRRTSARAAQFNALQQRLQALDDTAIVAARAALEQAADQLAQAVGVWNAELEAVRAALSPLGAEPGVEPYIRERGRVGVKIGAIIVAPQPLKHVLYDVALDIFDRYLPRREVQFETLD